MNVRRTISHQDQAAIAGLPPGMLGMSRYLTRGTQIFIDLGVLSAAYWLAFMFRFEFAPGYEWYKLLFFTWPYVVVFQYLLLVLFKVPSFSWRYVSLREVKVVALALTTSFVVLGVMRYGLYPLGGVFKYVGIPFGILAMDFVLSLVGVTGVRASRRLLGERIASQHLRLNALPAVPTVLIGAGEAGVMVAKEISSRPDLGIAAVCFLDDDRSKLGTVIHGIKVCGSTADIVAVAARYGAHQALITIAGAAGKDIRRIKALCDEAGLTAKIIPGIYEIVGGTVNLSHIRPVAIEDLLGREPVKLDLDAISEFIQQKVVLVTGAGGSIGSEMCRQVAQFGPARLILVERFENALFEIHTELRERWPDLTIEPRVADVTDRNRMQRLLAATRPEVLFHAAAHKHVPMMEWNPGEAIKNNVLGTRLLCDLAAEHQVRHFVMISTDKAVNPTSVMGASKRVAELYVQGMARRCKTTTFVSVRFGNVLGSNGSVVPIFKRQILAGGPVCVTHPEMKRYFMTIPEASQLVLQAATMGQGGEVFILDMGEPVKILDLARDLIRLSGLDPDKDIEIKFTGVRPGEKLFEELANSEEHAAKTGHHKVFIGHVKPADWNALVAGIDDVAKKVDQLDERQIYEHLRELIPEFSGQYQKPATVIPLTAGKTQ